MKRSPVLQAFIDIVYEGLEKFGRYYSSYRAFVVDNEDPKGWGRVRLQIPGIADNEMDYWAWPKNQFSGRGFGCKITPPKGTLVWAEFEQGDPNKPLFSHGHFGEPDELPKELHSPNIFWFRAPKGSLVEIDDDKEEIRVTDFFENKIVLNKNGVSIKTSGKVFLGDENQAAQPATLGDTAEKILAEHNKGILGALKSIEGLTGDMGGLFTKLAASGTPLGAAAMLISQGATIAKNAKAATSLLGPLNESISGLTKEIPKVKSSKIRIDE